LQKTSDLLNIKLYMGLAYVGLSQDDQARAKFVEVCQLDPKHTLTAQEYSAKAVSLYNEAKASCPSSSESPLANVSITHSTFQQGKALYEKGEFSDALKYFNVVLA